MHCNALQQWQEDRTVHTKLIILNPAITAHTSKKQPDNFDEIFKVKNWKNISRSYFIQNTAKISTSNIVLNNS